MARRHAARLHGFLIIDKPAGWTSHDVVARVRKLTGQRSVGHTGTLDPAATGVLPLALGNATKVLSVIGDSSKTYRAEITFAIETDTFDADGAVVAQQSTDGLERVDLPALLQMCMGSIQQQVPRYSAIQRGGQRLYELARAGVDFEPPVREATIHEIQMIEFLPPRLTICVDCAAGTYIRSLASDLGKAVGAGAYLSDLVRLRLGGFTLADAWTITQLEQLDLAAQWPALAHHPDSAILDSATIILNQESRARWQAGLPVTLDQHALQGMTRAYTTDGDWLGFGFAELAGNTTVVKPKRVIATDLGLQMDPAGSQEDRNRVRTNQA